MESIRGRCGYGLHRLHAPASTDVSSWSLNAHSKQKLKMRVFRYDKPRPALLWHCLQSRHRRKYSCSELHAYLQSKFLHRFNVTLKSALTTARSSPYLSLFLFLLPDIGEINKDYHYSAKKLKLRRVLQTLCGAFERCSRVRL